MVLLEYKGENHGMDKPAPKWLTDGVPLLKMKDHLEERVTSRPVSPSAPAGAGGGQ